jgi:Mrp family chromosome partitioning ATPase/capsular polysaccharide biosynthesis protein
MTDVSIGRDSNVLNLKVVWTDPVVAAKLANELARAFVDTTRSIRREDARETYTYYSAQLDKVKQEVRLLDERVFEFQREHSVSNFDEEVKVRLSELSTLETQYQTLSAEVNALRKVEIRLQSLITEQPDVLRKLIEENVDSAAPENTYAPNEKRQELELRLFRLTDDIRVSEARMAAIGGSVSRLNEKLSFLSEKEKEYIRLKSRQESAHQLRGRLATWAQESRVLMERNEPSFAIVEDATPPPDPLPTRRRLLVAGGGMFSLFFGLLFALLLEYRDRRIRSGRDLARIVDTSLVMEWHERKSTEGVYESTTSDTKARLLEFRRLLNDLEANLPEGMPRALAVVSTDVNPRQSEIVANCGLALASKELNSLLVDAEVSGASSSRLAKSFNVPSDEGLKEVLEGTKRLRDAIQKTNVPHLHLIGRGNVEGCDEKLLGRLGGRRMRSMLSALGQFPGIVIYDLPSLAAHETAVEATSCIGACVVLARAGASDRVELGRLVNTLRSRGVDVVAGIVTDVPARSGTVEQLLSRVFESSDSRPYTINEWSNHVQHA